MHFANRRSIKGAWRAAASAKLQKCGKLQQSDLKVCGVLRFDLRIFQQRCGESTQSQPGGGCCGIDGVRQDEPEIGPRCLNFDITVSEMEHPRSTTVIAAMLM